MPGSAGKSAGKQRDIRGDCWEQCRFAVFPKKKRPPSTASSNAPSSPLCPGTKNDENDSKTISEMQSVCHNYEIWAALKGTNLRGTKRQSAVFCGFLRFSAVSLRKSAVLPAKICVSQMLCFPGKDENLQKSAKICENLRKSAKMRSVCPLRFVPLSAP